jgi:hypothetical protein
MLDKDDNSLSKAEVLSERRNPWGRREPIRAALNRVCAQPPSTRAAKRSHCRDPSRFIQHETETR